jgi:uncharacterized peroxidase-related enzyme
MTTFPVPTRDEVSPASQQAFDALQKTIGFVPNLYATLAHSPTALADYLTLQSRKSSLRAREREVVNLVVSEVNECDYCRAAHTAIGKSQRFTEEQILEIRSGTASFDRKLDALARFVREVSVTRGHPASDVTEAFLAAGYTRENTVDVIVQIGDKTVTNYLHGVTRVPVDFPAAPELATAA